jgi:hypothetical protein
MNQKMDGNTNVGCKEYCLPCCKIVKEIPYSWCHDSAGVVYPQYWLHFDAKESFHNHLDGIKATFCHPKKLGNDDIVWVLKVLSTTSFGVHQSMVKMALKSTVGVVMAKSHDINPLMRL